MLGRPPLKMTGPGHVRSFLMGAFHIGSDAHFLLKLQDAGIQSYKIKSYLFSRMPQTTEAIGRILQRRIDQQSEQNKHGLIAGFSSFRVINEPAKMPAACLMAFLRLFRIPKIFKMVSGKGATGIALFDSCLAICNCMDAESSGLFCRHREVGFEFFFSKV